MLLQIKVLDVKEFLIEIVGDKKKVHGRNITLFSQE